MKSSFQLFFRSNLWTAFRNTFLFRFFSSIYWHYIESKNHIITSLSCKSLLIRVKNAHTKEDAYPFGPVYVSLTSFPARLDTTYFAICSLLVQDTPANKIILTLSKEEFPNGENGIPQKILNLKDKGLEILWGDVNLKPHNKYFYAMRKYPSAIIITADDDIIYPRNTITRLIHTYKKHPHAICALGVRQIIVKDGKPAPFARWNANLCYEPYRLSKNILGVERMDLLAEGGSSVLYPPNIMPEETFNISKIKQISPFADDIWLKGMQLLANIPVVCYNDNQKVHILSEAQKIGLYQVNMENNQNDVQFLALLEAYKDSNLLEKLVQ